MIQANVHIQIIGVTPSPSGGSSLTVFVDGASFIPSVGHMDEN